MVLAFVTNFFTNGDATDSLVDHRQKNGAGSAQAVELPMADTARKAIQEEEIDDEAARPPYLHVRMPEKTKSRGCN